MKFLNRTSSEGKRAKSGGRAIESHEAIRVSRNRAWLIALFSWPVMGITVLDNIVERANRDYDPPLVVTVKDDHVTKVEIGTPAVLSAEASIVESEASRYMVERYTLDPKFREERMTYVRLHSVGEVADFYNHLMAADNKKNPYYALPEGTVRRVRDIRIRIYDREAKRGEATFSTLVDGQPETAAVYWHVMFSYDFIKQALQPKNRYINGTGFVITAFTDNTEPGYRGPAGQ
ncbi:type IV secretion system protein [Burkholderia multivorans]|uniref:type IV secretion system protein n=1 Tax=Burkholderia multivorans TaxID=87883 RepID=UPI00190495A1|nr:type IV secretion system protein [Burkholderia multivorans]MBJ9625014.1 type IV secretion system protein [Burkholderia multivorans]